jgi:4-hydroxybenzoate polyprenyltransferase
MAKRSKLRAYLLLARVSNLPTVWTNVAAAHIVADASIATVLTGIVSISLFYTGGMFLNDAFDASFDAAARSDRPIPAGDVSVGEVFTIGAVLLVAGELLLLTMPYPVPASAWGAGLAAAIVFYDFRHKGQSFGPVIMGLCRALVYTTIAAGAAGAVSQPVIVAAVVMWAYVIALTQVAKMPGRGSLVPWLIAGICLVDAIMIAIAGAPAIAVIAASGFVLTLLFQRVVPGT